MPQIPGYKIQSNVAFAREGSAYADPRAISYANSGMGDVADSLNRLGKQVMDVAIENKQKRDTIEATKLASEATLAFNQQYEQLELSTDNPDGFMEKTLALHDQVAKQFTDSATNAEVQQMLQQRFEQTRTAAGLQAINFGVALGQVKAVNDLDTAMNTASNVVRRNPEQYGAQKALMESMFENSKGFLKPDAELRFRQKMDEDLVESQVLGIAERNPNAAKSMLDSGQYDKMVSADKMATLQNTIEAEQKKQQAEFEADFAVRVSRGQVAQGELDAARRDKRISPSMWASLTIKRDDVIQSAQEEGINANSVRDALLGQGGIDPNNQKQKNAADRIFQNSIAPKVNAMLLSGDPSQQDVASSLVADFVQKTGYVPKSVKTQLYAAARAGDADSIAQAADLFQRLERANPAAVRDMEKKDVELLRMTVGLMDSGLTGQQAAQRAKELDNPIDPATAELRQTRLNDKDDDAGKFMKGVSAAQLVQDTFKPGMLARTVSGLSGGYLGASTPDLPEQGGALAAANRDAQNLFKYWYLKTGDVNIAKQQAKRDLQRSWSVSNVGGKPTLMKYAPETMYGIPGRDPSWMKQQLLDDVKQMTGDANLTPDKLVVVSDNRTEREATGGYAPSYGVLVQDKDGVLVPLQKEINGRVVQGRWSPNATTELDKIKDEAQLTREYGITVSRMRNMLATKREWIDKPNGDQVLWFNDQQDAQEFQNLQARAWELKMKLPKGTAGKVVDKALFELHKVMEDPGGAVKKTLLKVLEGASQVKG